MGYEVRYNDGGKHEEEIAKKDVFLYEGGKLIVKVDPHEIDIIESQYSIGD
jgi:hypothetical protein